MAAHARQRRAGGQVAEVAVDHLQGFAPLEVTSQGEAGVGGAVEAAEEVLHVFQGGGVKVFL